MMKFCVSFLASVVRFALSCNHRWRRNKVPACTVGLALAWLLLAGVAGAADNSWKGSTSANWSDVGNWNLGHVPTSSEAVRLDNLSTANLNMVNNACAPGDLNCDGNVDAGDYVYWRKTNGSAADYTAFQANFGTSPGIGLPILGIASTSVSSVGPNIGGTPTQVMITGKPLRIGATGLIAGSGNPLDPVYPGPSQVNVTIDTDVYLTADQRWKLGGPGTNVSGRNQAIILGASPNSHTVYLNGFKPSISVISNGHDMLIVNSKLVDGTAPSKIFITKATGSATTFTYDTGNVNTHERVRFMGDNTYSGGTDILGGRQLIQIGSSSVKVGSTIVSGPFGTGPINTANDTFTGNNNQTPNFDAFGADREIDNDINCATACTINVAGSDGVDDDTATHTLTFGGTINVPASATITQNNTLHGVSSLSHIAGSGDAIFNGNILLTGDSSATRTLTLGQIGGTPGAPAGKQVFNGVLQQSVTAGPYAVQISNGNATTPVVVQFNAQNTYTGGTTITTANASSPTANANLGLGSSTVLDGGGAILSGPVGTGTLSIGSATAGTTSSVEALGGARTIANPINLPLIQSNMVVRGSNDLTLNGAIGGFGAVTMNGTGKLTLGGASTYAGATNVNSGTLLVNGSISGTSGVSVASGAILGGSGGTITSTITNNGTIAPGASVGTLNVTGAVNDQASSNWAIELSGTSSDLLAVTGNVDLSAADSLNVTGSGTGSSWVIATYTGSLLGTFDSVTSGFSVDYGTGTNSQITLHTPGSGVSVSMVPEPGTICLGLFAVCLATVFRRRNHGKR